MTKTIVLAVLFPVLLLAACDGAGPVADETSTEQEGKGLIAIGASDEAVPPELGTLDEGVASEAMLQAVYPFPYFGTWVCFSRYVGPLGWGYYYGYAQAQSTAILNALAVCSADHWGHTAGCVVTGCQLRW